MAINGAPRISRLGPFQMCVQEFEGADTVDLVRAVEVLDLRSIPDPEIDV